MAYGGEAVATPEPPAEKALWEWRLAAFGRYGPAYPASDYNQFNLIPLPLPIYRGKFLRLGEDTQSPIRGRVFRRDRIKLDIAFDLNFPVDSKDIDEREGLPDLDFMLEIGPELEFEFAKSGSYGGKWFFALQGRPAFSFDALDPTYRGVVFSTELTWKRPLKDSSNEFRVRVTPSFATRKYMEYYYAVDPEFATPARPAYKAKAGYLGTNLTFTWIKQIDDALQFVIGTRASLHQGARNDDSPLFTGETGLSVYAAFTWKFWESKRRVTDDD